MSSFSILNTAFRGLSAAQAGIDVTGQNVANVNTPGYTRQRVQQSATALLTEMGLGRLSQSARSGQGVTIDGVARLGNLFLESRVRQTASADGYAGVRAAAFTAVEDIHGEPSDTGLSAALQSFWGAWQDAANSPGKDAQAWVVVEEAGAVVDRIVDGRARVETAWGQARTSAGSLVAEINTVADKIAALNTRILDASGQNGSANELVDQRNQLAADLARLAGAQTSTNPDGTVNVLLGGNLLVDGNHVNEVRLVGASTLDGRLPTRCGSSGRTVRVRPSGSRAASSRGTCRHSRRCPPAGCTPRPRRATTRSRRRSSRRSTRCTRRA